MEVMYKKLSLQKTKLCIYVDKHLILTFLSICLKNGGMHVDVGFIFRSCDISKAQSAYIVVCIYLVSFRLPFFAGLL